MALSTLGDVTIHAVTVDVNFVSGNLHVNRQTEIDHGREQKTGRRPQEPFILANKWLCAALINYFKCSER
jgi:hypothetical protein